MHGPSWMALLPIVVTVTVVMAGLAVLAGYSLLNRKPWGRMLAIVLAVLALFKFPVGTALGIYTLWVLAPMNSAAEYDSIADRT
jgi:ABC-type glycerol-3-phosphate transport system permease component